MTTNQTPKGVLLPRKRWWLLYAGTLVALSVYYVNYGTEFHEGTVEGVSGVAVPLRLLSVFLIVAALRPFRVRHHAPSILIVLYGLSAASFVLALAFSGLLNDVLFLNTLLQLPILWALCQTRWSLDYARWLRFIGAVLILQACIDLAVLISGQSLWLSKAFVGGFGNPSSFGISCVVLAAFFLFHPKAGRGRLLKAIALGASAVMSKSLFAALAVAMVYAIWMVRDIRRVLFGAVVAAIAIVGINRWLSTHDQELFVLHKLAAAGAFVGLVDYDVDSSATVAQRSEMHERTFAAIAEQPLRFVSGHLEGRTYWPIDSQVLTYLGSFGAPMVVGFVLLHVLWMACAIRRRKLDGNFAVIALGLFGLIFLTNRILDYFPIASLYFLCISMVTVRGYRMCPARGSDRPATTDGASAS